MTRKFCLPIMPRQKRFQRSIGRSTHRAWAPALCAVYIPLPSAVNLLRTKYGLVPLSKLKKLARIGRRLLQVVVSGASVLLSITKSKNAFPFLADLNV